jgi:hypothetical protein
MPAAAIRAIAAVLVAVSFMTLSSGPGVSDLCAGLEGSVRVKKVRRQLEKDLRHPHYL